ncbi:hypothetical protein GS491_22250 [Rhodococcus hoagii]|nr:hypothetical protein [Prescottella equi]NKT03104.1 hypothetical protein [Prescottella equi]
MADIRERPGRHPASSNEPRGGREVRTPTTTIVLINVTETDVRLVLDVLGCGLVQRW